MILLCDSRQQASKHSLKNRYFIENGITVNRVTLHCGDYQIAGKSDKSVDTKKDIQELIGDIQFKAISKKDVLAKCQELAHEKADEIFKIICDDDSDRFAEEEITKWCFLNGFESETEAFKTLYVKRHGFFHRGLVRAKAYGIKLFILVENEDGIKSIRDLFRWVNPRRRYMVNSNIVIGQYNNGRPKYKKVQKYPNAMMGDTLAKACLTMEKKYGCEFVFCHPSESGRKIIELLEGE